MNEMEASAASSSPELSQQRLRASGEQSIPSTPQIQSLTTGPAAARLPVTGAAADTVGTGRAAVGTSWVSL